ncbi:hypothetical protein SALBM135S_04408 [Streptomyces alboniger]
MAWSMPTPTSEPACSTFIRAVPTFCTMLPTVGPWARAQSMNSRTCPPVSSPPPSLRVRRKLTTLSFARDMVPVANCVKRPFSSTKPGAAIAPPRRVRNRSTCPDVPFTRPGMSGAVRW